jgi:hypothetical protein
VPRWLNGRLARYAGQDGQCFPAVETLGAEIGVGKALGPEVPCGVGESEVHPAAHPVPGKRSNQNFIEFLWHPIFQEGVNDSSGEGVNDHWGVNDSSPKESQIEESHVLRETADLDYPAESQKARFAPGRRTADASLQTISETSGGAYPVHDERARRRKGLS